MFGHAETHKHKLSRVSRQACARFAALMDLQRILPRPITQNRMAEAFEAVLGALFTVKPCMTTVSQLHCPSCRMWCYISNGLLQDFEDDARGLSAVKNLLARLVMFD